LGTSANQSIEPTGGSCLAQPACGIQWRRPPVAHARRWLALVHRMRRSLCGLLCGLIFVAAGFSARGEEPAIHLHEADAYMNPGTNQWWLPLDRLERLPRWRGVGNPPVSVKTALRVARKWIARKSGDGDVDHILLRPINPDASKSKYRLCYFYTIEFCVHPYGNHITCVVLMDGSVLEPKFFPWREPRPTNGLSQ
jgi:hypothetical protein